MGTKVLYLPDGTGKIIQNLGRENETEVLISGLLLPDGDLKDVAQSNALISSVCGTDNTKSVCETVSSLTGHEPKIFESAFSLSGYESEMWRLSNNPMKAVKTVAIGRVGREPEFCIYLANLVGRMCLPVFGVAREAKVPGDE